VLSHREAAISQRQRDNQAAQKNHHRLPFSIDKAQRGGAGHCPASSQQQRERTEFNQKNN
jgi:hypothetical protein